jgi:hypothetical protein
MYNQAAIPVRGEVHIQLKCMRTGRIKYEATKRNLIVTAGANAFAALVANNSGTRPAAMGVGTNSTAPAAAQTDLSTPLVRKLLTSTVRSTNQITYSALFATGVGTGAIQEGGLFTATTAGTMFARFLTGLFNKASTDALTLTWKITFGTM